jgi:hypothetical protein
VIKEIAGNKNWSIKNRHDEQKENKIPEEIKEGDRIRIIIAEMINMKAGAC